MFYLNREAHHTDVVFILLADNHTLQHVVSNNINEELISDLVHYLIVAHDIIIIISNLLVQRILTDPLPCLTYKG